MANTKEDKFILTEIQEEYLKIYHEYFVLNWTQVEICSYHNCSRTKVSNAISWVIKNKIKIPANYLIKGAIDSVMIRLKRNKELYEKESSKKRYKDNNFIISLTREIREDERLVFKLQEIYKDEDEDNNNLSAGQVLKLITEASKVK